MEIAVTFDVQGVDPTRTDPHEIAEYLLDLYDVERRAGNGPVFTLAEGSMSAEWLD